ncbi:MAG: hypothetical protein JEZ01_06270 [Labilibaculum sp.]|nr:chondroitinase-B domain-containing protein [Labilibaculum sp.]MBI9057360.1 hypothetical protein [Labilibaculum sp.]
MGLLYQNTYAVNTYVSNPQELQTAVDNALPGETIILKNGIYKDFLLTISTSGLENKIITIKAEHGGKAKFQGKVGILVKANYLKLSGFDFDNASQHNTSDRLIDIQGSYNLIEDMYINHLSNGSHRNHRYIYFSNKATHNTIDRCWFEKEKQHGMVIFGDNDPTVNGTYNIIQNCYFKAKRQPDNGGSAIRFGTGMKKKEIIGANTVRNNLFDHYDGENEIMSIKSSNNLVEANTFKNCYGQLTCRHYHNNIVKDNFFITTDSNLIDGGTITIWGEGHQITNNYFYQAKPRYSDAGAIIFTAGNGTHFSSHHQRAKNILIKDNIIYECNSTSHAITFGNLYERTPTRILMPENINITGNCIYQSTNKEQIHYVKDCNSIHYSENIIYKNAGFKKLPEGIYEVNPNFKPDMYGIYRLAGKGPKGNPLSKKDVGPKWLKK